LTIAAKLLLVGAATLQRQNTEISKQIFREKEYRGLSPNFHIYVSVSDLYISTIGLPILLEEICRPILGIYKSLTDTYSTVNMEIGAEAVLFPEKEYRSGIFVAVQFTACAPAINVNLRKEVTTGVKIQQHQWSICCWHQGHLELLF
jgi:hypothetical protein